MSRAELLAVMAAILYGAAKGAIEARTAVMDANMLLSEAELVDAESKAREWEALRKGV
jgi:hypothetical protein